jgi:hypothetical protein
MPLYCVSYCNVMESMDDTPIAPTAGGDMAKRRAVKWSREMSAAHGSAQRIDDKRTTDRESESKREAREASPCTSRPDCPCAFCARGRTEPSERDKQDNFTGVSPREDS